MTATSQRHVAANAEKPPESDDHATSATRHTYPARQPRAMSERAMNEAQATQGPADPTAAPSSEAPTRPDGASVEIWRSRTASRILIAAVVLWLWSLTDVDLRAMTDVGLLSVLPSTFFVALALLTVGFVFTVEHQSHRHLLGGAYLLTLSAMAHATPARLYGTVRYSWSWKHLGIVDFIQRNGGVDPDVQSLQIYHGWPGLFSGTAMVSDLTGVDAQTIAIWTPFALNLVALVALWIVFRTFVDVRIAWFALWLFVIANWVGQEYFSPQGFTFALYLALLAIVLPLERIPGEHSGPSGLKAGVGVQAVGSRRRLMVSGVAVLIVVTIVSSHQLTPIMVVATMTIVAMFGVGRTGWLAITTTASMVAWVSGPGLTYLSDNVLRAATTLGSPTSISGAAVLDTADISSGRAIVVVADRFLVEALIVLAIGGLAVLWRRHGGAWLMVSLIAAPGVLLITDFNSEVLLRSYLFAAPWIALCGAIALVTVTDGRSVNVRLATRSAIVAVLLVAFLFAYLGKERTNYFTPDEIALSEWLSETAPPNTLLIEGSRNYPGSFRNYENFFSVPISNEPDSSLDGLSADPEAILYQWMTSNAYDASYIIITRSMKNEQISVPSMPSGLLFDIESALRSSDRFEVVQDNQDGTIWVAVSESP